LINTMTPEKQSSHFKKKHINISTFPNLFGFLNVALLTISMSSSSRETSFSTLLRIKTYIRSTTIQDRLSSLAVLNIEIDVSNSVQSKDILDIQNRRFHLKT